MRKHLPDKGEEERGRRGFPKKREQMPRSSGANPHDFGGCKDLGNVWSMGAYREWEWGQGSRKNWERGPEALVHETGLFHFIPRTEV